jgi:hypothetical protein
MIDELVIRDLCELGARGEVESREAQDILARLRRKGHLSRVHWNKWNPSAEALDTGDLVNLVRGLVLTEGALKEWSSGSVSPVIWTFRILESRSPQDAEAVAEWGRHRSTNGYVPFSDTRRARTT